MICARLERHLNVNRLDFRKSTVQTQIKMAKVAKSMIKVKEENEIQNYINSFKEIEEAEENNMAQSTPAPAAEKIFIASDQNYEQMENENETEAAAGSNEDEYKYVFIVQDDEEGDKIPGEEDDEDNHIYEFEDFDEEAMLAEGEGDDKTKIIKVGTVAKKSGPPGGASSGPVHVCQFCNYTTSKRYLLARHMKCHSEERPHKCNVCERGFKTIASLTNHVNTHTGIKVDILIVSLLSNCLMI
jgi:hypothetical protein